MTNLEQKKEKKIRTTLYLSKENRKKLDMIPKGQKTELMNYAIAKALHEVEREKAKQEIILSLLSNCSTGKRTNTLTQDALQEIRSRELQNLKGDKLEVGH